MKSRPVQRMGKGGFEATAAFQNKLNASQGGGKSLPTHIRRDFEPKFGTDFSKVRVHTGNESATLNNQIQATAFTHERRIRIVRALSGSAKPFGALLVATGIPASSLWMHLEKLQKRGFVKSGGDHYRLAIPGNALGRALLKIAVQDEGS